MSVRADDCVRVLAALEDLATQEGAALRTHDFPAALEIQDRAAPLIAFLVTHGNVADSAFADRLRTVQARREESSAWLTTQLNQLGEELRATRGHQRRVARIAPAYGQAVTAPSQLTALG